MGAALNTASASTAYVLAGRGTWLAFKNRGELVIAVEGDSGCSINTASCWSIRTTTRPKKQLGPQFIDWLVSPEGQNVIAGYKINGEQLFYPKAGSPDA